MSQATELSSPWLHGAPYLCRWHEFTQKTLELKRTAKKLISGSESKHGCNPYWHLFHGTPLRHQRQRTKSFYRCQHCLLRHTQPWEALWNTYTKHSVPINTKHIVPIHDIIILKEFWFPVKTGVDSRRQRYKRVASIRTDSFTEQTSSQKETCHSVPWKRNTLFIWAN